MRFSYYRFALDEESRQQYATHQVQLCQSFAEQPLTFETLLGLFRGYGEMYDQGHRLRDYDSGLAA